MTLSALSFYPQGQTECHAIPRSTRILFIFARISGAETETEISLLAQRLTHRGFRFDAMSCSGANEGDDLAHRHLMASGIRVDTTACHLSVDDTIAYLRSKVANYEILVAVQFVAEIYPALEGLRHLPPFIQYGHVVADTASAQNHFTTRYVGASDSLRAMAAAWMQDRPDDALHIPSMREAFASSAGPSDPVSALMSSDRAAAERSARIAQAWVDLFEDMLARRPAAPVPRHFRSFMQGGFESSTHVLHTGRRLDVIAATGHDQQAGDDYRQLAKMGLLTVRDAARWHLIEKRPGQFDFSSFLPMAHAAQRNGTQVIWDLMHYGWPDYIDIWSAAFVPRFADFAYAVARVWRETTDEIPFWCPINEMSFFAWAGGDVAYLNPFTTGRGFELKVQLARASIAATQAMREVDDRARFVQCEPLIAVHHDPETGLSRREAVGWHEAQFQAVDLLTGQIWPQIGGDPSMLDILGINYYPRNQWIHGGTAIDVDHRAYRPLSDLLFETYARFKRPILISETGVEDDRRAPWLRYVASEVAQARQRGIPIEGICVYPILNHLGWDDDRPCQNGLLTHERIGNERGVHQPLAEVVAELVATYPNSRKKLSRSSNLP